MQHSTEQPVERGLGHLLYEARFPIWFRIPASAVLLAVVAIVALVLREVRASSNWLGVAILTTFVVGMPFVVADMLFAWTRFYERGIRIRDWRLKLSQVGYEHVAVVGRSRRGLEIFLRKGKAVKITGMEGNFDRIEEIIRQKAPPESQGLKGG